MTHNRPTIRSSIGSVKVELVLRFSRPKIVRGKNISYGEEKAREASNLEPYTYQIAKLSFSARLG